MMCKAVGPLRHKRPWAMALARMIDPELPTLPCQAQAEHRQGLTLRTVTDRDSCSSNGGTGRGEVGGLEGSGIGSMDERNRRLTKD
jgi:hypothetical protein